MSVNLQIVSEAATTLTGTLTSASAVVTGLSATSALVAGQAVTGTGIPYATLISSIDSATQVTLTANATASGSASLTFPIEPLTLAETKLHLRVSFADDDTLISTLITAARRRLEAHAKRAFVATTIDEKYDSFPFGGGYYNRQLRQFYGAFPGGSGATFPGFMPTNTGIIEFHRAPLISVTSVTYYDSSGSLQTLDTSVYDVSTGAPGRIMPSYGHIWPTSLPRVDAVTVRYVAGYGTTLASVPGNVKAALKLVVKSLYDNRDEVNESYGSAHELPRGVQDLMSADDWGSYS